MSHRKIPCHACRRHSIRGGQTPGRQRPDTRKCPHNLSAKAFGFPRAIAHGMWLKARTIAAFEGRLPERLTVDVAFKTPVFVPSRVELAAQQVDGNWTFELRNVGSGRPHLLGEIYIDP